MPRRKATGSDIKIPAELKALGATGAKQVGNKIELTMDTTNLAPKTKRKMASGLVRAGAGAKIVDNDPWMAPYFEGPYSNSARLSVHEKMKRARAYFHSDPLVGKIIEFMKVFSNDGFKNEHSDPKIKKFYDDWAKTVNLELVMSWMFLEYYRSGNVVTYRELVPFEKEFKFMASPYSVDGSNMFSNEAEAYRALAAKSKKKMIPGAYTVMDPISVFVEGNNAFNDNLYFSNDSIKGSNSELVNTKDAMDNVDLRLNNVPSEMRVKHQGSDRVPLSSKNVRRVLRMRQPYEPYGSVMMERAFAAIHEKNKLRQMDLAMVNSVINQIVKVTIGNDEFPATPRQLKNLASAFNNIGKSQIIFWNHTLAIEVIRPNTEVLNKEKYERVNEDIRNAFGISEVLTGGGSAKTNFATAFLSLKAFLTNLKEGRKDVLRWVRQEYEDIAQVMGFDSYPEPTFDQMSLTDEIAEKQIIIQLIDRGVISYQTAQSRLGYDPDIELQRREEEKPYMEEGILGLKGSPFQEETDKQAIDEEEEVKENIEIEKNKEPQTKQQEINQRNRDNNKNVNPSKKIPDKKLPKETDEHRRQQKDAKTKRAANKIKAKEGRPKTPVGKKPGRRKPPKIKGQQ